MSEQRVSRRERYRAETREEAKQIALGQLEQAGPSGLSFNAIAKEMGLTGPALYRYFAGRDALLAELITDAYNDLADALTAASAPSAGRSAADRFRALARAHRGWSLAQPHRYRLMFGDPVGSGGVTGSERIIPASSRSMAVILSTLRDLDPPPAVPDVHPDLDGELQRWAAHQPTPDVTGSLAHLGLLVWTRLHGILSLEIEGHFASMGFDPGLLYSAEVDTLLAIPLGGSAGDPH